MKPCRKARYPTHGDAMAARKRMMKRGRLLSTYQCARCQCWHLGNNNGTRIANINAAIDRALESDRITPSSKGN